MMLKPCDLSCLDRRQAGSCVKKLSLVDNVCMLGDSTQRDLGMID